jgi:hypothetical protein
MGAFRAAGSLGSRATALPLVAALTWALVFAPSAAHAGQGSAKIVYLSGATIYVDAGRDRGLREGDSLQVVRGGATIAWLRVSYLSSHKASCDTLRTFAPLKIGDVANFTLLATPGGGAGGAAVADSLAADTGATGRRGAAGVSAKPAPPGAPRAPTRAHGAGLLRGRVGARFLTVQTSGGGHLTQPALDLRIDGSKLAGAPLDLAVDFRGRRLTSAFPGQAAVSENRGLFYTFSLTAHDVPGRYRLTLGRQLSPALAPVNLFDGGLAERRGERWDFGFFSGTQPDPRQLGLSGAIMQGGGYISWHQPGGSVRRWSLTSGAITSYDHGNTNRDFGFLQGFYVDRRLSASLDQEMDVNRGWKRELGQPALAATGTFLSANLRLGPALSLRGGYDNRRSVWLFRDRTTPENLFDDRFREGAWGGTVLDLLHHLRLLGDVRTSSIGNAQRQNGWTGGLEGYRIARLNLALRGRYSRLTGADMENTLSSFGAGLDPTVWLHVEGTAGRRTTKDVFSTAEERTRWESGELDLMLGRRAYWNGSFEVDHGGSSPTRQAYSGLSWRF